MQKVVQDIAGSAQVLDRLTNFEYRDANGKDHVSQPAGRQRASCLEHCLHSHRHAEA